MCGSGVVACARVANLVSRRQIGIAPPVAAEVQCGVLSEEASLELLLRAGGCEELLDDPPDAAREAVEICGRLLVHPARTHDTW